MNRHIGHIIKQEHERSGMKLNVFAERIGMTYRNVYRVFDREDINTELLERIGNVLNYDFFQHYIKTAPDIIQEPQEKYNKKDKSKPLEISLNIKFSDDEKQAELLKLLFGDNIPDYLDTSNQEF